MKQEHKDAAQDKKLIGSMLKKAEKGPIKKEIKKEVKHKSKRK